MLIVCPGEAFTGMAVISGVGLIKSGWEGDDRASVRKKTHRGTPSCIHISTSHHTSHKNYNRGDDLGPCHPINAPPEVPHHLYWLFSVLHGQEKAVWKSRPGHLLLFYHCVLNSIWMYLWCGATKCISLVVQTWSVFPNLVTNICEPA